MAQRRSIQVKRYKLDWKRTEDGGKNPIWNASLYVWHKSEPETLSGVFYYEAKMGKNHRRTMDSHVTHSKLPATEWHIAVVATTSIDFGTSTASAAVRCGFGVPSLLPRNHHGCLGTTVEELSRPLESGLNIGPARSHASWIMCNDFCLQFANITALPVIFCAKLQNSSGQRWEPRPMMIMARR